jgi:hypothetical protein
MIVIRNSQLTNETVSALNNLIDMDINAKLAFRLMRIIKEVSSLVEDKVKLEKKIFEKYLEKDANGNPIPAVDENNNSIPGAVKITSVEDFNKEMYDLMSIENTIPYDKVNFDDLKLETVKVKDLIKIDFLFE